MTTRTPHTAPSILRGPVGAVRRTVVRACAACAGMALVLAPLAACGHADTGSTALPRKTDVEVIAFQQPWNSIARECTQTYGPAGVAYVEISPPQESIRGTQWWTSYQPVSYRLDSKLGTEKELARMIEECSAAGVGIIADVVLNQTTGVGEDKELTGVAGTRYNPGTGSYPGFTGNEDQYPEGVNSHDFHDYNNGASISNYRDQDEVQQGRLSGMWDFDSSSAKVRDLQSDYLARLYRLGVRGFRMDAVKHIDGEDVKALKQEMAKKIEVPEQDIYWIQEVIGNAGEAKGIQPSNYFDTGTVTQFAFAGAMKSNVPGSLNALSDLRERLGDTKRNPYAIPTDKANVFVTNWDTERNGQALSYKDGAAFALANAFSLAYDYGTPRLISDYRFTDNDAGAPGATETSVPDVNFNEACATNDGPWNCEQRWTPTRGMIAFHNYVHGTAVDHWQEGADAAVIAFSRTGKGFIAMNGGDEEASVEFETSMPDGEYCNVYAVQDCSKTVRVRKGKVRTSVPARSAVALYAGATAKAHPSSPVAVDPSTPRQD